MGADLTRFPDWAHRLNAAIDIRRARPFGWGVHDCGTAYADLALAMTGIDLAAALRGRYADRIGAQLALRAFAGGGLEQAVQRIMAAHECREVEPAFAQRGDACLADVSTSLGLLPSLGACIGDRSAHPADVGWAFVPMDQIRRAWRVG